MLTFRPDHFAKLSSKRSARKLWAWLQTDHPRMTMQIACHLRRPAVEALSPDLVKRFPTLCASHRGRQMIGHMVRQVMENDGFHLDRPNVKTRARRTPFRRGSTYRA